jgi:hypothetical protein
MRLILLVLVSISCSAPPTSPEGPNVEMWHRCYMEAGVGPVEYWSEGGPVGNLVVVPTEKSEMAGSIKRSQKAICPQSQ